MSHLVRAGLAAALLIAMSFGALAADRPIKRPIYKAPPPPPPVAIYDWSGCYVGHFVGAAFGAETTTTDIGGTGAATGVPWLAPLGHSFSYKPDTSFLAGGALGCNWQQASFVHGLELELGYLRMKGETVDPTAPAAQVVAATHIGDWYGVLAARFGFAADRTLFYLKGGAAFFRTHVSVVDNCNVAPCGAGLISANASSQDIGWALGGGMETALASGWILRAEYLYLDKNDSFRVCGVSTGGGVPGATFCWNDEVKGIHTVKLGVNHRFDWGSSPLWSKY